MINSSVFILIIFGMFLIFSLGIYTVQCHYQLKMLEIRHGKTQNNLKTVKQNE